MARVKKFYADFEATGDLYRTHEAEVTEAARGANEAFLERDQRGPRGGRYVMVGPVMHLGWGQPGNYWDMGRWVHRSTRFGRYRRPSRA